MYDYKEQKKVVFTEEGQKMFLAIRDNVKRLIKEAGAVDMEHAIATEAGGDSWERMACVDRLVELKEIREIPRETYVAAQYKVFIIA